MRCLKERFSALSAAEQDRLKSEARAIRAMARRAPSRLDDSLREQDDDAAQGPWGLAAPTGSPFPLRPSALSEALVGTNVVSLADGWAKLHTVAAEPSADFPDTVDLPEVCVGGCCRDFCPPEDPDPTDEGLRRWAPETRRLWRHLLLACRFGPTTTQKDPFVVLRFDSAGVADFVLAAHQSHNDNSLFEGTFFPNGASRGSSGLWLGFVVATFFPADPGPGSGHSGRRVAVCRERGRSPTPAVGVGVGVILGHLACCESDSWCRLDGQACHRDQAFRV